MKKFAFLCVFACCAQISTAQTSHRAFTFDFFSPVAGCLGLSMEVPGSNFVSWDYELGGIGVKLGDYFVEERFYGAYASIGPRLYFDKDMAERNDFRGPYVKTSLLFNGFYYEDSEEIIADNGLPLTDQLTGTDLSLNLLLSLGVQDVYFDKVVLDLWFGLGYGGGWRTVDSRYRSGLEPRDEPFKYSYTRMGMSPLVFDGGLSIGLVR